MLAIVDLALNFGGRTLFSEVNLNLSRKQRYGITGANGSGKSTFLKILAKEETPSQGSIDFPNKTSIGFLKQDHYKYEQTPILDVVLQGKQLLWDALQEKESLLNHEVFTDEMGLRLGALEEVIAQQDGYVATSQAHIILKGLGVPEEKHLLPMSCLSGGYKLRVLLAQSLFSAPDILLLDEPTNHLDILAMAWLEKFLISEFKGLLLLISHDHDFLNNIATCILDIDFQQITAYSGNYETFLQNKTIAVEQKERDIKSAQTQIDHMQSFVDRFKAKASKAKQAQSRAKVIDKIRDNMQTLEASSRRAPMFRFDTTRPSGKNVLKVERISKFFDDNLILDTLSFEVKRHEKLGIIGANGIGKSTLLKILTEQIKADEGSFSWGHEVHLGYFAQDHHETLQGKTDLLTWLSQKCTNINEQGLRAMLGNMLFADDDVFKPLSVLSGGEAARVIFAYLQLKKRNVLVLDEPTNHLDAETIESLGSALRDYQGTLLLVSHNRHFLKAICNRILFIAHDKIYDYTIESPSQIDLICEKHL